MHFWLRLTRRLHAWRISRLFRLSAGSRPALFCSWEQSISFDSVRVLLHLTVNSRRCEPIPPSLSNSLVIYFFHRNGKCKIHAITSNQNQLKRNHSQLWLPIRLLLYIWYLSSSIFDSIERGSLLTHLSHFHAVFVRWLSVGCIGWHAAV